TALTVGYARSTRARLSNPVTAREFPANGTFHDLPAMDPDPDRGAAPRTAGPADGSRRLVRMQSRAEPGSSGALYVTPALSPSSQSWAASDCGSARPADWTSSDPRIGPTSTAIAFRDLWCCRYLEQRRLRWGQGFKGRTARPPFRSCWRPGRRTRWSRGSTSPRS